MSNAPALTPKDIVKILKKHGFVFDRSKGSHQIWIHPTTHKRVVVPFHVKDLPKGTMYAILRQSGIELHKDE